MSVSPATTAAASVRVTVDPAIPTAFTANGLALTRTAKSPGAGTELASSGSS